MRKNRIKCEVYEKESYGIMKKRESGRSDIVDILDAVNLLLKGD